MAYSYLKVSELKLGDVIECFENDAFNSAIVKNVTDTEVFLYRPYASNFNTVYYCGIICMMGLEEYSIFKSDRVVKVWRRQNNLK